MKEETKNINNFIVLGHGDAIALPTFYDSINNGFFKVPSLTIYKLDKSIAFYKREKIIEIIEKTIQEREPDTVIVFDNNSLTRTIEDLMTLKEMDNSNLN